MASALTFIRENIAHPIHVGEVPAHAGLSRRVLERRFTGMLGRTPAVHIARARLDHLKELLAGTALPIASLAEKCGFCSPEYMTAIFRKETGTTPLRYRRESRGR